MRKLLLSAPLLIMGNLFSGCESGARDRRLTAEATPSNVQEANRVRAASYRSRLRTLELNKQQELNAIEQRRTGDVYSHSCRKAVVYDPSMPVSVDTTACTPQQLRLEQEAERRQTFDRVLSDPINN